ncbi:MAG: two-component sensor histidine kinase [Ignavibacteriae bacterium]|nr:two-component sensor histidine kinase [Ignavibacteriota bacterium]MCB9216152.1 two-component sensor histidine kinase [Ignavibacteria bacterium]
MSGKFTEGTLTLHDAGLIVNNESVDSKKQRNGMKRSLRQWRRQTGLILTVSSTLLLLIAAVLLITIGMRATLTSIWFWISAGTIFLLFYFHRTNRQVIDELQDDIAALTSRASTIGRGEKTAEISANDLTFVDLERLNDAITSIAEKATRDISELKRLEQVRSEFLGNVSHELRTPIFSIQGYLETLIDGAIDDPHVRDEFLEKAHNNMLRLHSLLNDLIEISRIESGAMKMSFRYFDLLSLAEGVIATMESPATLANVSLRLEVNGADTEGKIMALGDRKRIEQVLVNLATNGVKYNKVGGEVIISLTTNELDVHISVSDTGIGIPPEQIGRVFERFYRVDKGRSRDVGGTGLGLAIVKHIVEAHGSKISVQSHLEEGTSFSFTLPRDK